MSVVNEETKVNSNCSVEQARVLHGQGQNQQAIDMLQKVIEEQANNMEARELLGDIYMACNEYTLARRQYRYIFDRRRHEVSAAIKLAEVYMCLPKKTGSSL